VISYSSEYNFTSEYSVEDVDFPNSFLKHFRGPRLGMSGIRQAIGVSSRPILGAILKPRAGAPLDSIVKACSACLEGGMDYITDDELVVDPEGDLAFDNRVPRLVDVAKTATERTGRKKWYVANITASPKKALQYGKKARDFGADGLLVNAFTMGFPALEDIAEANEISLPIITCNMGTALLTRTPRSAGLSEVLISKLSRIAGADGVHSGIVASDWYSLEMFRASNAALRQPFTNALRPAFPVVAGGLNLANLVKNLFVHGTTDVILLAGAGVMGFPTGTYDGAQAFHAIADAFSPSMSEADLDDMLLRLAKKLPAVKSGLTAYGYKHRPKR
jgi:ribulose 1,5-bisphosphate carboxylase large subunit-like protein